MGRRIKVLEKEFEERFTKRIEDDLKQVEAIKEELDSEIARNEQLKKKIDDVARESFLRGMEEATADANAKWQELRQDFNEEKRLLEKDLNQFRERSNAKYLEIYDEKEDLIEKVREKEELIYSLENSLQAQKIKILEFGNLEEEMRIAQMNASYNNDSIEGYRSLL